jgi:hypothetical protein
LDLAVGRPGIIYMKGRRQIQIMTHNSVKISLFKGWLLKRTITLLQLKNFVILNFIGKEILYKKKLTGFSFESGSRRPHFKAIRNRQLMA